MADEEQLDLLNKGVSGWNKWREENANVEIDLSRAILTGAILTGAILTEADFTKLILD